MRSAFKNRGKDFTPYAVSIRCVRPCQSSATVALHLLHSGAARLRVVINRGEYFIPFVLLLRALREAPISDEQLYERLVAGDAEDSFVADRVLVMLRDHGADARSASAPLLSREQCLAYLGSRFRRLLRPPTRLTDAEVGKRLLKRHVLVHLSPEDESVADAGDAKAELLMHMLRRLYALAAGREKEDSPDSLVNQEVLLPGHLWAMMTRENLHVWLRTLSGNLRRERAKALEKGREASAAALDDDGFFSSALNRTNNQADLGRALGYFLATGNLRSESGLDLQQTSGFTIVAERLNYMRFIAHFRSIHRGAFFAQLRTTTVRKLLPDSWGFLCPVHTPDGSPCGLLNHLAAPCYAQIATASRAAVREVIRPRLLAGGAVLLPNSGALPAASYLPILLDGELLGHVHVDVAARLTATLREAKAKDAEGKRLASVLGTLEIALITADGAKRAPMLVLASAPARFLRPVLNVGLQREEHIGSLEQTTLRIACAKNELRRGEASHCELAPTNLFSLVASLTPFCDFNQSPRNMYQCQMGKQTMAVPFHSIPHRTDTKAYHLHTPQSPIVKTANYDKYGLNEYPLGTNAVVAVISYTGYDMEDAMIVNKGSYDRGFCHASVRTVTNVDLSRMHKRGEAPHHRFGNLKPLDADEESGAKFEKSLDIDGLPEVGTRLKPGAPLYVTVDEATGQCRVKKHSGSEEATVEEARLVAGETPGALCDRAFIKLRYNRNPVPGDKFSSRHGQKGVVSRLWPCEDMPFSETGIIPDILFNPHGFPSRMTIGMLLESMAGKAGAVHGVRQDATAFTYSEKHRAVDYFGEQLREAGYSYHGTETMYSGVYGTEMKVQIFLGIVYYQRLRHMVSDKHQVRAKGPINPLTKQPVHGRKVHGGIRLGEMERDALLAHGTAFLLHDRMLHCSDEAKTLVCTKCGSLLSPMMQPPRGVGAAGPQHRRAMCRSCGDGKNVDVVTLPYVFFYLTNELAAMNIKTQLVTSRIGSGS